MNFSPFLEIVLAMLLLICSVLCYAVFASLKKIRIMERDLKDSHLVMKNMNDVLKSNLLILQGANKLLLIVSQKSAGKSETAARDRTESEPTLH